MSDSNPSISRPGPSTSCTLSIQQALQQIVPYLTHPATTHIAVSLLGILIHHLATHILSNYNLPPIIARLSAKYLPTSMHTAPSHLKTHRASNPHQHLQIPRATKSHVSVEKCIERLIRALPEDSIVTIDTPVYRKVVGWDLNISSPKADEVCLTRKVYEKMIRGEELEERMGSGELEAAREGNFVVDYGKMLGK